MDLAHAGAGLMLDRKRKNARSIHLEQPRAPEVAQTCSDSVELLSLMDINHIKACIALNRDIELAYEQASYVS